MGGCTASESVIGPEAMDIPSRDLPESMRITNHPVFANAIPARPLASRPESPEVSSFHADSIILRGDQAAARIMGDSIREKVCRTTLRGTPALRGVFDPIYAAIEQRGIDVSLLRQSVEGYLKEATEFLTVKADISRKFLSEADREAQVSAMKFGMSDLKEIRADHQQTSKGTDLEMNAICQRREHIKRDLEKLKRELEELDAKEESLKGKHTFALLQVSECDADLAHLEHQLAELQRTPIMTPEEKKTLETMESFLHESRNALQSLQWLPE